MRQLVRGVIELLKRPPALASGTAACSGFEAALGNGEPLASPPDTRRADPGRASGARSGARAATKAEGAGAV